MNLEEMYERRNVVADHVKVAQKNVAVYETELRELDRQIAEAEKPPVERFPIGTWALLRCEIVDIADKSKPETCSPYKVFIPDVGTSWVRESDLIAAEPACHKCHGTGLNDIGHEKGPIPCAFCESFVPTTLTAERIEAALRACGVCWHSFIDKDAAYTSLAAALAERLGAVAEPPEPIWTPPEPRNPYAKPVPVEDEPQPTISRDAIKKAREAVDALRDGVRAGVYYDHHTRDPLVMAIHKVIDFAEALGAAPDAEKDTP